MDEGCLCLLLHFTPIHLRKCILLYVYKGRGSCLFSLSLSLSLSLSSFLSFFLSFFLHFLFLGVLRFESCRRCVCVSSRYFDVRFLVNLFIYLIIYFSYFIQWTKTTHVEKCLFIIDMYQGSCGTYLVHVPLLYETLLWLLKSVGGRVPIDLSQFDFWFLIFDFPIFGFDIQYIAVP